MSNLTVKALKTETGVTDYQLKQKCQEEHLRQISQQHVVNHGDFAAKFGLLPALIAEIQIDPSLSFAQKTQKVFTCWRDNNVNATYLEFVQVCLELGNGAVASKMCEICKEGVKDLPFPEATTLGTNVKEIPPASTLLPKSPSISLKVEKQPARKGNVVTISADGVRPLTYEWFLGKKKLCDINDQDYGGYTTDELEIKNDCFLTEGVLKCKVKDKYDCVVESDELDLFEEELRNTWKLEEEEIGKIKDNGFKSVRNLQRVSVKQLDKLCLNAAEEIRMEPLFASVQKSNAAISASIQSQSYLQKLDELMADKTNTIELQYLKMYFIGPSGLGKTTTRQRLVGSITNLSLLPKDQRKRCSTFLAECEQVLAFLDKSGKKLEIEASANLEEETQLIFSYLMSCETIKNSTVSPPPDEQPKKESQGVVPSKKTTIVKQEPLKSGEAATRSESTVDVEKVVTGLRSIVSLGEYSKELQNKVLLNLVDIGGQPGFVEMFPFLSKGAGIFLAFFRLDKDLDDMCQVSYERGKDKITPYDSTYTSRETLSQILSAIAISHYNKIDSDNDRELCSKLGYLGSATPVATLIGTFKDELAMQIKVDLLYEEFCALRKAVNKSNSTTVNNKTDSDNTTVNKGDTNSTAASKSTASKNMSGSTTVNNTTVNKSDTNSTAASKSTASKNMSGSTTVNNTTVNKSDTNSTAASNKSTASKNMSGSTTANSTTAENIESSHAQKKAIWNVLTQTTCDEQANISAEDMAIIQQTVSQHPNSDVFKKDVEDKLKQKLEEKNEAVSTIASKFDKLLSNPKDRKFIAVDNYEGTDSDMEPLRVHIHGMISSYFKNAKLRIRPQQLLFGVVLRKEYDIVSMEDCIRIGTEGLNMREEEVRFTVWYLDRFVGALIYHPDINDKHGWFEKFVICNPQVVFNSLSVFVVKPLLELHSEKSNVQFKEAERKNWILKGQFSMDTITRCHMEENQDVKKGQLIPVEKLLILLEHSHLLATITTEKDEKMYFIPAILKCASREELTKPPPTDTDTPSPIKITFNPQYVPTGIFCAMISELVSRGSNGILGMTWKLAADSPVKRNLVSFHIDEAAEHFVTLIAHFNCYEIRIIRQDSDHAMHELCSYVLSTVLFVMKEIRPLLSPIIAFDCYCGKHKDGSKLCVLTSGVDPCFKCTQKISLNPHQECWFAQEVGVGGDVSLLALPFASDRELRHKSLSFEWSKRRPEIKGVINKLELQTVSNGHFNGLISCDISKNEKLLFTVYHWLKKSAQNASGGPTESSEKRKSEPKPVKRTEETIQSSRKRGKDADSPASNPKRVKALQPGKIECEQVLMKIGRELGNQWIDVGVELGMVYQDLKYTIDDNPKIPHHLKPMEMFQKWKSKAGDSFTYVTLASALEKVGLHTCAQTNCYE